ncbi:MAG: cytochrome P450 [Solirubrobacterales bacterium]
MSVSRKSAGMRLPPGPRMPSAVQTIGWWSRPIPFLERCRSRYGPRFTIRLLGAPPFVMLSDPAEVKELFTAPDDLLHPGEGAAVLEPVVGANSVILLDEGEHLEQRRLLLPAFHGERLDGLAALVEEVTEREVASWPAEGTVALHPRLQALTLEVILRAVFGLREGRRLADLRRQLGAILQFGSDPVSLLPQAWWLLGRTPRWARFERLRSDIDANLGDLVAERRAAGGGGDDVLAMLLEARHEDGGEMSWQEIRDELMTLLVAGHETTASELAWTFERLSREPAVLSRLTDELDGGGEDYLAATIQETLRRRPVLPNAAPRLVKRAAEVGGWAYPPGVCLVANAYLVHHDPAIYPDPYAFRPERFLSGPPGTYTWIPFGGGRRRCLGANFAIMEMGIVLRAVLRGRRIAPGAGEPARRRSITISPGRGAKTSLADRAAAAAG